MKLRGRFDEQLKKVQALPEKKRKIIFWAILIAAAVILIWLWLWRVSYVAKNLDLNGFKDSLAVPAKNINVEEIKSVQEEFKENMEGLLSATSAEQYIESSEASSSATSSQN
jgi:hypothetical protein